MVSPSLLLLLWTQGATNSCFCLWTTQLAAYFCHICVTNKISKKISVLATSGIFTDSLDVEYGAEVVLKISVDDERGEFKLTNAVLLSEG